MLIATQTSAARQRISPFNFFSWISGSGIRSSGLILVTSALLGASLGLPTLACASLALAAWLGAENGGNDVSKGIAPLVCEGLASVKSALLFGSAVTLAGSLVSFWLASELVKLFSTGLVQTGYSVTSVMTFCIVAGAAALVAVATRFSLPVSTTHALIGALVPVVILTHGLAGVTWGALFQKALLPLFIVPPLALLAAGIANKLLAAYGLNKTLGRPGTWLSCGGICFMRAVNDTPKIAAVAALSLTAFHFGPLDEMALSFLVVSLAMFFGSYFKGHSVTETLAVNLARSDQNCCFAAPATTIGLIFAASHFGLPVSTTHVSVCSIIGCKVGSDARLIDVRVLKQVLMSWVVTIPLAGIFGLIFLFATRSVGWFL